MSERQPGARRRLDASVAPEYDRPTRVPRLGSGPARALVPRLLALAWALATVVAATSVMAVHAPSWAWRPAAAVLLVVFAVVVTVRVGGRMRIWVTVAALVAVGGVSGVGVLLVVAAALTGILTSVAAVMLTRPAASFGQVLREFAVSFLVAVNGAVAVAAWNAPINVAMFISFVGAGSVAVGLSLVWTLGAGLHGLSRQYRWFLVGVAVVAIIVFVYSGIVRNYGSPGLKDGLNNLAVHLRGSIGGVPRPFEVLIGYPAVVVGTSLRSRYREGWWITAFAVLGATVVTTGLVDAGAYPSYFVMSTLYSAVLGLLLGLLARRFVLAPRSARAARAVQPPSRTEPGRFEALR